MQKKLLENMFNIFKFFKAFPIFIFLIFLPIKSFADSDIIKQFKVNGNERISDETIILFSGLKIDEQINKNLINTSLKKLYETSFFSDVKIDYRNNIILISVIENPLIQNIIFEGIKRQSLVESLKNSLIQKEKSSFIENKIKIDQDRIINSLRVNGYYFSKVNTSFKKNNNNTVDIIYNIELGNRALIKNIKFIGKKVFKENKLRKVIVSEEAKFWKFLSSKKTVDVNRFALDENLLKNFYKNKGYYEVKINSSFAQIIEDKYFEIIFNIDAGEKFTFNELVLNIPDDYNKNDFKNLFNVINNLKSKPYSLNKIEDILDEIDLIALDNNYEFVSATYDEKIIDNNKINLTINLKDSEKYYVEKINIYGNFITSERVLRNKLLVDEGDPFNEILVNRSINDLIASRLFKNVKPEIETSEADKTKIININVEERPTGEIFAGAGTGTSGSSISAGISENNYLGEGIKLGSEFSITEKTLTGSIYINEPNYKNSKRSLIRSIERSESDYLSTFGYKTAKTGFGIGTSYEQYKDIYLSPKIDSFYEEITTNSKASSSKKKQQGDYLDVIFNYDLTLNKLNQNFNPTDGYKITFTQEIPTISKDYTLINRFNYNTYYETDNNLVFSLGVFAASANSMSDDDARITKRIFIPSRKLRGFEPGKIGPKDGTDYIGGNYGSAVNLSSTLPNAFAEFENLDLSLFYDAANVWGVDYDSSISDNSKIRSSTGVALDWFTPIGPLSLSYSFPITKESSDKTEKVRFNIGTTF